MKTAYPQTHTTCSIRLYSNIPFDNTYKNHTMISSLFTYNGSSIASGSVKELFLDRRDYSKTGHPYYYPRYDMTGEFNFNFTNGLVGSVVLELTAEQTNANYLRLTCGDDVYYYFIIGCMQVNADTYQLSLELDVLMTYQDEFLTGMKNVPVFTARKHSHRYTANGLMPYCADLKTGEDMFAGVKPSIIKGFKQLHYKNSQMKKLEGLMWLYICIDMVDVSDDGYKLLYSCNGKRYPLHMLAVPINATTITYQKTDGTKQLTYTSTNLHDCVKKLINDGHVHGAKVSPYPPFGIVSLTGVSITKSLNAYTIASDTFWHTYESGGEKAYGMTIDGTKFLYATGVPFVGTLSTLLNNGAILISEQSYPFYPLEDLIASDLDVNNASAPTITSNRYLNPKLLFAPFRKYVLGSQYASSSYEFYPELLFSEYTTTDSENLIAFNSYATAYIGDNNFYTEITSPVSFNTFKNYIYEKLGLSCSVNYQMPCGTDALDVFNTTQRQSFYTSKVASGITSGITMVGGVASTVLGASMLSNPATAVMGAGMIAGGATAFASGTAGLATTIKSVDAKIEDLKNTPDSINISGADFISDDNIINNGGLPYVLRYECLDVIKERADDFFYNYGYQVARECYFNTELKVNLSQNKFVDNNLFGRTIFNYIQTNEDITNKINANIPLIIKQKISSIFNNGITLWTFFKFRTLYDENNDIVPTSTYYIDNWFMKCKLDNTEMDNTLFNG